MSCFTSDIEIFVDVLSYVEKEELLEMFMKASGLSSLTPFQALGQTVTVFRIKELFSSTFRQPVGGKLLLV